MLHWRIFETRVDSRSRNQRHYLSYKLDTLDGLNLKGYAT